uniref:G protein-coupled receptor 6 n=2 Tax=Elephantid herpesvirus 1 TaxID=146015 RepID=A0A386AU42_ELHV1|nr:G protein-coupled receptor 6 [Elephant endotheliotropic herpesvirus 1B]AYC62663.1 G protein-coupled receptor 6 [Elephant endotheliotropic herpesvirus 1A]UVZ34424.1 G protein-coupled receptor 6 [Elephant endotheliotropic herpesvirus 1B]
MKSSKVQFSNNFYIFIFLYTSVVIHTCTAATTTPTVSPEPKNPIDSENIVVPIFSAIGIFATLVGLVIFILLLQKRIQHGFPYNTLYLQLMIFIGILLLFVSAIVWLSHGHYFVMYINQIPFTVCFACLLIYAFDLFLIYKYGIALKDWVLVLMAVFCILIAPITIFYGYAAIKYIRYAIEHTTISQNPEVLKGDINNNKTLEIMETARNRLLHAHDLFREMSYIYTLYIMLVAFLISLYSVKRSVYGRWLCLSLACSILLWIVYRCVEGVFGGPYLFISNGYLLLILYIAPTLLAMWKGRPFYISPDSYVSAVFSNTE